MLYKIKLNLIVTVVMVTLFVSGGSSDADSFPFRSIAIDDTMPQVIVNDYKTQQPFDFETFKGKPYVAVFWGADVQTKKKRSIEALKHMQEILPFCEENQIPVVAVNAIGDLSEIIEEVHKESGGSIPFYFDSDQKVYGDLGIFVIPAILLIDKDGKVKAGMGFSHDIIERLKGEIEIMLDKKTREQVELDLHPEVVVKSEEEKTANRHMSMAQVLLKRGMADAAVREFLEAIKVNPNVGSEAYIQLGCLYFDNGNLDEAVKYLDKGLELDRDSLKGQICMAKITAKDGDVDGAIADLQSIMMRKSRDPELHYVLGTFYEKTGKTEEALKEYRKAYELLEQKERMK
ncbi:MAG: tetratricopeptide repeat protein [Proteobacteria bacterium]|nr:tetratricopeptide repeat protein [Pseudomonadota bacterium]MBU1711254.1 tetratricopeptide repeat protein [Pseudomonadota bacterium]